MGKMSDLMIEFQSEQSQKWIRERLKDNNASNDSGEYKQLADEYEALQEFLWEQAEFKEELIWLKRNGSSILHKNFVAEIEDLKKVLCLARSADKPYMVYRMVYAHAVTLLEAFLGDTLKSLISENDNVFARSMEIDEIKNAKYSLQFLSVNSLDPRGLAIKEISKILYHNIPKIKKIYEIVLSSKTDIDISKVDSITKIRHDIVHRNGMTLDGSPVVLTESEVIDAIGAIREFSDNLQKTINNHV